MFEVFVARFGLLWLESDGRLMGFLFLHLVRGSKKLVCKDLGPLF